MASFSDALAGFLSPSNVNGPAANNNKTTHQMFINTKLLPLTTRLQRETRARRFRDVQPKLKAAIAKLKAFENQLWPPPSSPDCNATAPTAAPTARTQQFPNSPVAFKAGLQALDQEDEASVATPDMDDDNTTITTVAEENPESERAATTWNIAVGDAGQKLSAKEDAMLHDGQLSMVDEDDKNTREAMNESIVEILEVYVTVLTHPSRSSKVCELCLESIQTLVASNYVSGRAGGRDDHSGSGSHAIAVAEKEGKNRRGVSPPSLLHKIMEAVANSSNYNSDLVQTAACKTFRALITSNKCGIHEGSLLLALRSAFHVYLVGKTPMTRDVAKASLVDMLRSVFGGLEIKEAIIQQSANNNIAAQDQLKKEEQVFETRHPDTEGGANSVSAVENTAAPGSMNSQYHTDGYVLFRALCKLSSKELPGDGEPESSSRVAAVFSSPPDPMALNNKVLSLELILVVMEFSGNAFCQGEKFIYLVQNYLCVGLLKNCMSSHTNVAFLSQKIFLLLLYKFKANLKQEIEVFLSNIFLRVLESPNSSFKQKALVVEALRSLCRDPVILTQIFLNYDCDFDAMNLYKDIVHNLTKLSGKSTSLPAANLTKKEAEEMYELSLAGTEVLVTILKAFLKALSLPLGDEGSDESAGERIRAMLNLDLDALTGRTKSDNSKHPSSADISIASSDDTEMAASLREASCRARNSVAADSESSSEVAGKIVDAFEMKRNQEQNFEMGAVKFTLSLKSGLNFFIDNGFVECDAKSIALFFIERKDKLDKTQMGEVLGREPESAFIKGGNLDSEKGGTGFFVRILHHYVSALDFAGLMFDDAIRLFLSGFRLPGEAQKIDRIMEKFAERFTLQNPEVFPSADTAFILGFSVIMLNTDLHNPSIKPERRMTMDSFIRNNRGISENGSDLPPEFLQGIFERIKKNPFSLKEDDDARKRVTASQTNQLFDTSYFFEAPSFFGTSSEERKREKFKKEREEMMTATTQLITKRPKDKNAKALCESSSRLADSVSPADVVKPMFDVTWGPVIGVLSQVLECSEDARSIAVCLNGFVYAIRLASHSEMSLARDTFVTSLAKFTFLGSIKEMKRKNIESIRTLLSIAVIDGAYLGESWGPVLQCTSQLARLRLSASGLDSDETFLSENDGQSKSRSSIKLPDTPGDAKKTEESNGRAVLEAVNEVLIDKVFSNTVNLSAQSLAHFIEQLIIVSTAEINGSGKAVAGPRAKAKGGSVHGKSSKSSEDGPSIFLLQKLVEVADFNMDVRPRLVWAQMWERMAEFFATISSHENRNVSVFAIDSLKQLSFKFLDKPELSEFNFQRIYLRPFLHVMQQDGTREDIRELVLRCLDNIVRAKSHNLRSGWKIIFSILQRSAEDSSEKINFLGLAILQRLLDDHLDELCRLEDDETTKQSEQQHILPTFGFNHRSADVEDFVGLVRASSSFVQKTESNSPRPMGLSMRALCHTAIYADLLAEKRVHPPVSGSQSTNPLAPGYTYAGLNENEALEMVLWRSLLEGLADGIRSKSKSSAAGLGCLVQRGSILALRAILIRHGCVFSIPQWEAILKETLLPAIQDAAENEISPVVGITSESPHLSSIDFLADTLPIPPPPDDPGLIKFEEVAMNNDSAPKRPFGKAELLLEASFTDMRHGGDGDLSRAYVLAQKDAIASTTRDQPFPDSWIATTAPIALGLLTDIASEVFLQLGAEGRKKLWPPISRQFLQWCAGRPLDSVSNQHNGEQQPADDQGVWWPCEALVRVACNEMQRLPERITNSFHELDQCERITWTSMILGMFSDALTKTVEHETSIERELFRARVKVHKMPSPEPLAAEISGESLMDGVIDGSPQVDTIIYTQYGTGRIVTNRKDRHETSDGKNYQNVVVNEIALDFGGTLYRPDTRTVKTKTMGDKKQSIAKQAPDLSSDQRVDHQIDHDLSFRSDTSSRDAYWLEYVPSLKARCVAAHCLQNGLNNLFEQLVPLMDKDAALRVQGALRLSQKVSEEAVQNDDLKNVFQEAIVSEWGDTVEEVQMALSNVARMSHLHGSDMFFLTQEAGAAKATIQMLGMLYQGTAGQNISSWDKEWYAEEHLIGAMKAALRKFQDSEERDGYLVDPNVWRNTSESGGKVALYCTSFAEVVVRILSILLSLEGEKFAKHTNNFFPILCSLVRADSREIRNLVQRILAKQIAPMIHVDPASCSQRCCTLQRVNLS